MLNAITLELNVASEVTFRKRGETEFATLFGIQNVYLSENRSDKLPVSILLQSNCVEYARKAQVTKGRRIIVHGKLTFSEKHNSYTIKADQLSVFPLSKPSTDSGDGKAANGQESSEEGLESRSKKPTKTKTK
jgi:hypothetical protein